MGVYALLAHGRAADVTFTERPAVRVPRVDMAATDAACSLAAAVERLRPLQQPLPTPGPQDWLSVHDEKGQTFRAYLRAVPVTARGKRRILYIQPLGHFDETQFAIVKLTASFMHAYFGLPVVVRNRMVLRDLPRHAKRTHALWGVTQIRTGYVLDCILKPRLPEDAAAYIALTTQDLWPGPGWNFVYGQASLCERVGVWSLYRHGDPRDGPEAFKLCLVRTLKVATHETGHIFSMEHCTAYACNMCGSNSREESDANPLHLCCECAAKLCWATGIDPFERYRRLIAFCEANGLGTQRRVYDRFATALEGPPPADRMHRIASPAGVPPIVTKAPRGSRASR
jgi:archaemetzincin